MARTARAVSGSSRIGRRWLALVLVACLAAPTSSCGGPGPTPIATPASSGTSSPGFPSATPAVQPSRPLDIAWTPAQLPVDPRIGAVGGVTGGPAGALVLVLAGRVDEERTSVITPTLGGWRLLTSSPPFRWPELVALPDRYLAFEPTDAEAASVWSSSDGAEWSPVTARGMMRNPMQVAASGSRVVACGQAPEEEACITSADAGASWQATDLVPAGGWVRWIAPTRTGFVALASDAEGRRRTAWSADGVRWTAFPFDPSVAGLRDLVAFRDRLVGAGESVDRRSPDRPMATLSLSVDGRTASRVPLAETESQFLSLLRVGDAVVAVGSRIVGQTIRPTGVLVSGDGVTWRSDTLPDALANGEIGIVSAGDRLLAASLGEGAGPVLEGRIVAAPDPGPEPIPIPTPPPDPVDPPASLRWEVAATFDGRPAGVTAGPDRIVVVGQFDGKPMAWSSVDGHAWVAAPLPGRTPSCAADAVTAWRGGFIATGVCNDESPIREPTFTGAFWRSDDGLAWEPAPLSPDHDLGGPDLDGPELGVVGVAAGPGRVVAVASSWDGRTFRSEDGLDWPAGPPLGSVPAAVAWTGDGLVAVGRAKGTDRGATWWSADGASWSAPTVLDSGPLAAVASDGRSAVAVGRGPAAWTSPDGRAWTWVPDQSTLVGGEMSVVAMGSLGITAAGSSPCAGGLACLVAWRSTDGISWSLIPLPLARQDDRLAGAAEWAGRVLLVGFGERRGANELDGAIVWIGRAG